MLFTDIQTIFLHRITTTLRCLDIKIWLSWSARLIFVLFFSNRVYSITKLELFEEWLKHTKEERNSLLCDFILKDYSKENVISDSQKKYN